MHRACPLHEVLEQGASELGGRGWRKTRARTLAHIRGQCELRNKEQSAMNIAHRAVHLAYIIRKYAITQEPLEQPVRLCFLIARFHTHKHEQATVDCGDDCAVNGDVCSVYPL